MKHDKQDILAFLKYNKKKLEKDFGVEKIGLFGSFARGDATEESDIDIAVEIKPAYKTLHNFCDLERYLSDAFEKKVDLGIESTLKPAAKAFISQEIIHV